ncbi:RNA polymerase subunit sigma [Caulobacter sp. Root487D2Y]|uniref:RNA polymerase sigma factor n=1 Tax=Caulobacter sp. Root487D2Y TaxID=1736547 RepID=UPI0006F280EE|nr:sigma-70 family RNA polymerase sigma factor [Caulobacter sp. Root487D2Y]KQY28308.1 RNA polymerase subunit sigma [Caulobacter sp. Root487D2Y]
MDDMIRLIEPLIPSLRRYARSLVRDASEADDLIQDCLERAVDRWGQRRKTSDARSWLFSILHNLAISRWRRVQRRGLHLAIDGVAEAALSAPASQLDGMQHADLLRALAELSPDSRAVILLVGVEDLTYAQAAEVLGVPIGTVMSRLSRARERLAQLIAVDAAQPAQRPHLRRIK